MTEQKKSGKKKDFSDLIQWWGEWGVMMTKQVECCNHVQSSAVATLGKLGVWVCLINSDVHYRFNAKNRVNM